VNYPCYLRFKGAVLTRVLAEDQCLHVRSRDFFGGLCKFSRVRLWIATEFEDSFVNVQIDFRICSLFLLVKCLSSSTITLEAEQFDISHHNC